MAKKNFSFVGKVTTATHFKIIERWTLIKFSAITKIEFSLFSFLARKRKGEMSSTFSPQKSFFFTF
jgi:hypothetical protein